VPREKGLVGEHLMEDAGRILLKPGEAARALAISPRKLWDLTKRGQIPHLRIGRSVRYATADLQAWVDSQKVKAR
jgi:excisionase family DNA binding protein